MNDLEFAEEAKGENPSEPLPDVATAAEPEPSTTGAISIDENAEENALVHHTKSVFIDDQYTETKFTQTFFKYMKNLSDKRCLEILNKEVDHDNEAIAFYQKSVRFIEDSKDVERY